MLLDVLVRENIMRGNFSGPQHTYLTQTEIALHKVFSCIEDSLHLSRRGRGIQQCEYILHLHGIINSDKIQ